MSEFRFSSDPKVTKLVSFLEGKGIKFVEKADTWMRFHPSRVFREQVVTTINDTIYLPNIEKFKSRPAEGVFTTLAHEYVHIQDNKKHKLFKLSYLMPQLLAVFSLLSLGAFLDLRFLFALGFLVFALKLPSPRMRWELRGYTMSLAVRYWRGDVNLQWHLGNYAKILSGNLYWMLVSEEKAKKALEDNLQNKVMTGDILKDQSFYDIHVLMVSESLPPSAAE